MSDPRDTAPQPETGNPPSRYKGRCDVHGLRTCDECQYGETDAKLLAAAEKRIAALEAELAEAQERLAMAVDALEEIAEVVDLRGDESATAIVFHKAVSVLDGPTAEAVAQHTAEVERRGAKAALEAFAERDDWTLDVPRSLVDRIRRLLTEAARAAELEGLDSDKT